MTQIKTPDDIKQLGNILCVWAHPDDESFLATGIMMAAIGNGQKVACITATKGEIGLQDPAKHIGEDMGDLRAKEMSQALQIVGCTRLGWMGYRDGECSQASAAEAAVQVRGTIASLNVDTILTFGPDGWTGHDDHRAVSAWVSEATKGTGVAVYWVALTPDHFQKYMKAVDEQINVFYNLDQPSLVPEADCDIAFSLPSDLCERKCAALKAHTSQTEKLFDGFDHDFLCGAFGKEVFVKA